MKFFVIDASVIVKWVFPERKNEDHIPQAIDLLRAIRGDAVRVMQPVHWLVEAIAVISRLEPKIADDALILLNAMEFAVVDSLDVYQTACQLSQRFHCHLFDTLYHAVALNSVNSWFITADEQYYKKAHKQGSVMRLADFSVFDNELP